MSGPEPAPEVLDARGVRCPMPVIMLARLAAARPAGGTVVVRWTDPAAATDIPAWARMRGHRTPVRADAQATAAAAFDPEGLEPESDSGWSVVVLAPRPTSS